MSNAADTRRLLETGISELRLVVDTRQVDALLRYLDLLQHWNKAYNLTAIREPEEMVRLHLLDCLAILPFLPASPGAWVDVGSGAGLPGVVLAILDSGRDLDLLDSNGKKTRFLFHVKTELGLDNMAVHHVRAEDFVPAQHYQVVLSRALASLADMVACTRHLCAPGGCMLAMKGAYPAAEIAELPADVKLVAEHRIEVPGVAAERHLLQLAIDG